MNKGTGRPGRPGTAYRRACPSAQAVTRRSPLWLNARALTVSPVPFLKRRIYLPVSRFQITIASSFTAPDAKSEPSRDIAKHADGGRIRTLVVDDRMELLIQPAEAERVEPPDRLIEGVLA